MTPWGFYTLHEPYQLTLQDCTNTRVVEESLIIYDCYRPVNTCAAFILTTVERARDLRQSQSTFSTTHSKTAGAGAP